MEHGYVKAMKNLRKYDVLKPVIKWKEAVNRFIVKLEKEKSDLVLSFG